MIETICGEDDGLLMSHRLIAFGRGFVYKDKWFYEIISNMDDYFVAILK